MVVLAALALGSLAFGVAVNDARKDKDEAPVLATVERLYGSCLRHVGLEDWRDEASVRHSTEADGWTTVVIRRFIARVDRTERIALRVNPALNQGEELNSTAEVLVETCELASRRY